MNDPSPVRFLDLIFLLFFLATLAAIKESRHRIQVLEECVGNALEMKPQDWDAKCKVRPK